MKKKSFDEANFLKRQNALYLYALKFAFHFSDDLKTAESLALRSLAEAQKTLPAASKRAFRKTLKRTILQNCAAYEDDPNANTPSPVQKAYDQYQNGRKRKKRFLAVTAILLAAVIVAAILCATLIPAISKRDNSNESNYSGPSLVGTEPYKIGETFSNSYGSIVFTGISAKHGLTVNGVEYDGYFLIISAVSTSEKFFGSLLGESIMRKYQENGKLSKSEDIIANSELINALSMSRQESTEEDPASTSENGSANEIELGKTADLLIFNYVYDLTKEQYSYMYEMSKTYNPEREALYKEDIRIRIPSASYRTNALIYAYFIFFYREIQFYDPPEEESGETEQPSGNESDTNS